MLSELEACESGLQNLKTTYADDSMIIANLDVILERQTAHQDELRRFLNITPQHAVAVDGGGGSEQQQQQKQRKFSNNNS